jgi:signal transduction histidine kinase
MPTLAPDIAANPLHVLVHDLRQPLSVIDACADYLNLVLPATDRRARRQLELLQEQVREANGIMHDALLKLHYPDAQPAPEAPVASSRPLTKAASAGVTY